MSAAVIEKAPERLHVARLPGLLLVVTLPLLAFMVVISWGREEREDTIFYFLQPFTFAVAGALIASRRPRNPIGWIFSGQGLAGALIETWEAFHYHAWPTASIGQWVIGWTWVLDMAAYVVVFLLFPTGRLPSPRWRLAAGAVVLALLLGVPGQALNADNPDNPWAVDSNVVQIMFITGMILLTSVAMAALLSLVVRYRRAEGVERLQLKQLLFAATIIIPTWIVAVPFYYDSVLLQAVVGLAFLAVPVAIGLAMFRYRLYDIDVVISRTLLVAGLAAFITTTYVAIVVGIGSLFGRGEEPNAVLSVLATAAVAVAFQPVRRRLRRVANRLVLGRRATPYDVLSGFATRVGAAEASPESLTGLAELLADGTGAQPARVWLRVGDRLRAAASWPDAAAPEEVDLVGPLDLPDADLTVPVKDGDELLGALTIAKGRGEQVTEVDGDLVERLAAASSVLLRNLRLDAELAERLEEIEASRRRLVTAQDDARRRIEAELGGGTRAQLETLARRVGELRPDVDAALAPKTAMLLDQVEAAVDSALETLAGLAAGVYPPRLAADGLVVALTEQADRSPIRVDVESVDVDRYDPHVEAAVYFAVLEALQNVAKYAGTDSARVRLLHQAGHLHFEVTDAGAGFDTTRAQMGTGLEGISDRLDTVDGTLRVVSEPGTGTTVSGRVPATTSAELVPVAMGVGG